MGEVERGGNFAHKNQRSKSACATSEHLLRMGRQQLSRHARSCKFEEGGQESTSTHTRKDSPVSLGKKILTKTSHGP